MTSADFRNGDAETEKEKTFNCFKGLSFCAACFLVPVPADGRPAVAFRCYTFSASHGARRPLHHRTVK
jgi:hypothetical protein